MNERMFAKISCAFFVITFLLYSTVNAAERIWTGVSDDTWNNSANWSTTPPDTNNSPQTNDTVTVDVDNTTAKRNVTGIPNFHGNINLYSGSMTLAGNQLGISGQTQPMTITQTGGAIIENSFLQVGFNSNVVWTLSGKSTASTGDDLHIAPYSSPTDGQAVINITQQAQVHVSNRLTLGFENGVGVLTVDGTALDNAADRHLTVGSYIYIGTKDFGGGGGISSGTATNSKGTMELSNSSLVEGRNNLLVGNNATGTLNIKDNAQMSIAGSAGIGIWDGSGTVNLSGNGKLSVNGTFLLVGTYQWGNNEATNAWLTGKGVMNLRDDAKVAASNFLFVGNASTTAAYTSELNIYDRAEVTCGSNFAIAVGPNAAGVVNLYGGSLKQTGGGHTFLSHGSGTSKGTMNIMGGHFETVAGEVYIGYDNTSAATDSNAGGFLNLSSGSFLHTGGGTFTLGYATGARGEIKQTGGSITTSASQVVIGDSGVGIMSLSDGGRFTQASGVHFTLALGSSDSSGTLNVSGGKLETGVNFFNVGFRGEGNLNLSGTGIITQTQGSEFRIGEEEKSQGTMTQTGGTFETKVDSVYIGNKGAGTLNLSGNGTFTQVAPNPGSAVFRVGAVNAENASGTVNLSGGTLETNATYVFFGDNGKGTLNLSGDGIFTHTGTNIYLGVNGSSVGTINQTGGTLQGKDMLVIGGGNGGGNDGTGIYKMSGGKMSVDELVVGRYGKGTMTVSGGEITLKKMSMLVSSGSATSTLNIIGGRSEWTIDGPLTMDAGAKVNFTIDSTGLSTLEVRDTATLDGAAIHVDMAQGLVLLKQSVFDGGEGVMNLITAGSISGTPTFSTSTLVSSNMTNNEYQIKFAADIPVLEFGASYQSITLGTDQGSTTGWLKLKNDGSGEGAILQLDFHLDPQKYDNDDLDVLLAYMNGGLEGSGHEAVYYQFDDEHLYAHIYINPFLDSYAYFGWNMTGLEGTLAGIQLFGASAVPEPATWVMLLMGGAFVFTYRRRYGKYTQAT